jgi:hypothetical protein
MTPCCQASLRVDVAETVAVEDAILLGLHPDGQALREAALAADDSMPDETFLKGAYTTPPKRYADMTKVTCLTLHRIGLTQRSVVREAMNAQAGNLNYAVAALCIWLCTPTGEYVTSRLPLHRVPLALWPDLVKPFSSECRRLGQKFGSGARELHHAYAMRRLVSLCVRTDQEADWDKELLDRTRPTTAKAAWDGKHVSGAGYRRIRDFTLQQVAQHVVRGIASKGGSFAEHFQLRWWRTPRGTTSRGGEIKRQLQGVSKYFDLQMRPIKPTVMELLDEKELSRQLRGPPQAVARGSTKAEPGMKRRALLALDDTASFVAGYASEAIEGATKLGGMVLQQTPSDVAEWVAFDSGPNVWRVSNDYTNFNILHSLRSMQLIDIMLAREWPSVREPWAKDKVAASLWVAESMNRLFIHSPVGDCQASCGLVSGHRNTARDNTILHLVYLRCVLATMRALFGQDGVESKTRICGDDETLSYVDWAPAVCHTLLADGLGFLSQVSKGLLSRHHDEFLQLMRFPGGLPRYPVANTILTFCSGNWYKDPVRDLGTTIKDVSDHVWDMILGGVPLDVGQDLAGAVLNYLMQVKDADGSLVKLEWVDYINGQPGGHPLWGCNEGLPPPDVKVDKPFIDAPKNAAQSSTQKEEAVWAFLGNRRRADVINERAWQAYRPVAKNWLQKQYDDCAARDWPVRVHFETPHPGPVDLLLPSNRWRAGVSRTAERSARAAAKACGFPPELLGTDDMWKAMVMLAPRDRARLTGHFADRQQPTTGWRWLLAPLLRAV